MKKNRRSFVSFLLVVVMIISSFVISVSAEPFVVQEWQYTAVTQTTGKSSGQFLESLTGSSDDYFSIYGYCQGGLIADFSTRMTVGFSCGYNGYDEEVLRTSEGVGSRTLRYTLYRDTDIYLVPGIGYVDMSCRGKTDASDKWEEIYMYYWTATVNGWRLY